MKIEPVYTTRATEAKIANRAVAVHCSDHRFQEAFREFLTEGLGLITYTPLSIPGGGHFGSSEEVMPKFAKAGFQSVAFLLKRTGAERIILIGHADCLFFKDQLQFFFIDDGLNQKQFASLLKARRVLRERFEGAIVEAYLADIGPDGHVKFLKIE